jgi:hypothetical protein
MDEWLLVIGDLGEGGRKKCSVFGVQCSARPPAAVAFFEYEKPRTSERGCVPLRDHPQRVGRDPCGWSSFVGHSRAPDQDFIDQSGGYGL